MWVEYSELHMQACVNLGRNDRDVTEMVLAAQSSGAFDYESDPDTTTAKLTPLYLMRLPGERAAAYYTVGDLIRLFGCRLQVLS
jgi:hypothetical protein